MSKKAIAVTVGAVLAILAIAVGVIYATPVFNVQQFAVEGQNHTSVEDIEAATGVALESNLVRVDPQTAASGVVALPWVKSATVARHLPSTLQVTVVEREAVAYTDAHDGPHLIDEDGEEFVIEMPPREAVKITGGESGSRNWAGAVAVIASVPAELRVEADSVDAADPFNYVFHMKDGRTVTWGANNGDADNANKARAFASVLKMDGQNWNISNPELVTSS
ncbi:cell division protein FtsQ/DivIB [Corynebacterium phoceense]